MGIWSGLAKGAMNIARSAGNNVLKPITKSAVNGIANPTTAIGNAAKAAKVAALPAAGGYIAWQNLANDKSALESVKDVVVGEDKSAVEAVSNVAIGEKNTERIAGAIDSVANAADRVSENADTVSQDTGSISNGIDGVSSFFRNISSGEGVLGMLGNLFSNIFKGNVSGMSMFGMAAAAFLTFGRFGWMGRIAGALLGMMLIGNNSTVHQDVGGNGQSNELAPSESESQSRGMHR